MSVSKGIKHKTGEYKKNCKGCGKEMVFKYQLSLEGSFLLF